MRVLHINVRLNEGGAAQIQQNLHTRLRRAGIDSVRAYGYGPSALSATPTDEDVIQIGRRPQVVANYGLHRLVGVEAVPPPATSRGHLQEVLRSADVVHLHAMHSFFLPLRTLVAELRAAGKPVVWTVHDDWLLTGRCAFSGSCEGWKRLCGDCPDKKAYPGTLFDVSGMVAPRRRRLVHEIERLVLVAPTDYMLERVRFAYPTIDSRLIWQGLDTGYEQAAQLVKPLPGVRTPSRSRPLTVVAADLSHAQKTNPEILRTLANSHVPLRLVGKNPPTLGPQVDHRPPVSDRRSLAMLLAESSALLFTSTVDSFGLVMAEAMAVGVPVLAVPSPAATAVLGAVGAHPLPIDTLLRAAHEDVWKGFPEMTEPRPNDLSHRARAAFAGQAMAESYIRVYSDVVRDRS